MKNLWTKLTAAFAAILVTAGLAQAVYIISFDRMNPQGTAPTASICGAQPDAGSTDMFGSITNVGTATCTLTFGTAFVVKPSCLVTDNTTNRATMTAIASTTALTITGITAADALSWACIGKTGG